jgi:hypothetical protein
MAIWLDLIAKCMLTIWQHPITKHTLAILATSYCLNRKDRVSSLYWTSGSKLFFSHVSRILAATFLFSVFANLLLTNFFVPFSAAREFDFSSRF